MPSSLPFVRPMLAALMTTLLLVASVLVSGSAKADAPAAPPSAAEDAPVSMDLISLTPTSLAPGGTLTAELRVTNTSSEPLTEVALELRTRTSRITERADLASWQALTDPAVDGAPLAASAPQPQLAPGDSTTLGLSIPAEELGYSSEPYYWGARRLALTVAAQEEPAATLRTFVVWRPADAVDAIRQSVLLPLGARDPAAVVTDPASHARSLQEGALSAQQQLAAHPTVDWWLDPALLDPPLLPVADEGEPTAPPTETGTGAEETPDPVRDFTEDPATAAFADLLADQAGDRTVLARPYSQADLVSLTAAGTEELDAAVREKARSTWESTGISPAADALRLPGEQVDAEALEAMLAAGATTAIVPAASLRPNPSSTVTPSSVGIFTSAEQEDRRLTLLAPDPVLSDEFSLLTAGSDTEQTHQRLLAETAVIASEYTEAPRHLLIAPATDAELDPEAAGAALDALEAAPWVDTARTGALLETASSEEWTTRPRAEDSGPYALGRLDAAEVRPSGPAEDGSWQHLDEAVEPPLLDPEALEALEDSWERIDVLATAMEDDAPLDAPRREILAGTSVRWRGEPEVPQQRAQETAQLAAELRSRIHQVPASGYNVISDYAEVPITVTNGLDTAVTVRVAVTADKSLVRIGEPATVTVPARGQVNASVDVEAIANGSVTLTTSVTTEDGRPLTDPAEVPLTVNPSWENWTTLVLVIAMGLLVVVGVARARRTGASTRAAAVRTPEDPEELARSGRSLPIRDREEER